MNRYTFRAGRQSYQDVLAAQSFLGKGVGKKIVVFAQDYAFGQGNVAAVKAVLGGRGHQVSSILVPLSATDFTPFAQQAAAAKPDLLFVAWAGTTAPAMWQSLQQQGVFKSTTVTTGLAQRDSWQAFGSAATSIKFLAHYVWNAPHNKVNDWLVSQMGKRGQLPDLFTPDGFVTSQMIVRALQKAGGDQNVDAMISGLEGWQFMAPKGLQRIRPQDHAMIQPMFQVQLVKGANGKFSPKVLRDDLAGNVQPPLDTVQVRRSGPVRVTEPVLVTENLGLDIGGATIVADVSLEVGEGEFLGIIGPNGAGKTSLFNLLSGLLRPTSGRISLAGRDVTTTPPFERARAGLGRTFQLSSVFARLSTFENVRLAAESSLGGTMRLWRPARSVRRAFERAGWAIERVGPARPLGPARGAALGGRPAQARTGNAARFRPARPASRRADGGGERGGCAGARRRHPHGAPRGAEDRIDGRAPPRGRHRTCRSHRCHASRPVARVRDAAGRDAEPDRARGVRG